MIVTRQVSWFDMVTPNEQQMRQFLREYVGPEFWRTPTRRWHELFMLQMGWMIQAGRCPKLRHRQMGVLHPIGFWGAAAGGTAPTLTDIEQASTAVAPTPTRQQYAYDSDGGMRHDLDAGLESTIVYTDLTTQTDDTNDHTNEWWPDQPDTNEGLNWDIMYDNAVMDDHTGAGTGVMHLLADNTGTNRTTATWYLLDTVSNDHADATHDGGIGCNRPNGSGKSPNVGQSTFTVDVDIRATGSGSAVASHSYDCDLEGT